MKKGRSQLEAFVKWKENALVITLSRKSLSVQNMIGRLHCSQGDTNTRASCQDDPCTHSCMTEAQVVGKITTHFSDVKRQEGALLP